MALNCAHIIKPHRDIKEIKQALELNPKIGCSDNEEPNSIDPYDEYFKFGFVRNPWSRVVSLYNRKEGIQPSQTMNFDEFVNTINYSSDACVHPSQHKNQLDWFTDLDGEVVVDFIGKFEIWKVIGKKYAKKYPLISNFSTPGKIHLINDPIRNITRILRER